MTTSTKDTLGRLYSFDLSDFEAGKFTATRYPLTCAVGGDWVCQAGSDADALAAAHVAAEQEWAAPDARHYSDFSVAIVDSCVEVSR